MRQDLGLIGLSALLLVLADGTMDVAAQNAPRAFKSVGREIILQIPEKAAPEVRGQSERQTKKSSASDEPIQKLLVPPGPVPEILLLDTNGAKGSEHAANWLATFVFQDGQRRCTATAIGPRVVLTAAHCVAGARAPSLADPPVGMQCSAHPSYRPSGIGMQFDYALCYLERPLPTVRRLAAQVSYGELAIVIARAPNEATIFEKFKSEILPRLAPGDADIIPDLEKLIGWQAGTKGRYLLADHKELLEGLEKGLSAMRPIKLGAENREFVDEPGNKSKRSLPVLYEEHVQLFERMSLDLKDGVFRLGDPLAREVLMSGFGCTERDETRGNDGNLRAGFGRIDRFGPVWLSVGSHRREDSAVICQGDSGGPAFRLLQREGQGRTRATGQRRIIAVNARNLKPFGLLANISFLAKTSSPAFRSFFVLWKRRYGDAFVCGIDRQIEQLCHR